MITFGTILYSLFIRFLLGILLFFLAVPLILCLLLPNRFLVNNKIFSLLCQAFYWFCIKFSFLPVTYKGLGNIPKEPVIVVANHQSSFDIPLIGYALGNRLHIWLAWEQLAKSPLLRLILPRIAVLVDMSSPSKGLRTIVQVISTVKEHPWDLIIFPEGGRYADGTVHSFYGGFSLIAKKVERPVVPIKIIGVNKVYPPKTFWVYYNPITVIVGKPMHLEPNETDDAFKERVYHWFTQESGE